MGNDELTPRVRKIEQQFQTYSLYGKVIAGILAILFGWNLLTAKERTLEILNKDPVKKEAIAFRDTIQKLKIEATNLAEEVRSARDEVLDFKEEVIRIPNLTFKKVSSDWLVPSLTGKTILDKKFSFPKGCTPIGAVLPGVKKEVVVFGTSFETTGNGIKTPKYNQYGNHGGGQIQRVWVHNKGTESIAAMNVNIDFYCLCSI